MSKLGSGLLVTLVFMLLLASYPTKVVIGSTDPTAEKRASSPTGAAEVPKKTRAVPSSDDEADRQEAARLLSKLKPGGQTATAARGPAVELPKRLMIPAIGVDAGFEFVGLSADGAMDVPKDAAKVAWYRLGPRPGERGNAVVAGHVDWGGKLAVFWALSRRKAGDVVEVTAADDRRYEFVVQWVRWYDASKAPVQEVFAQGDSTEITLITCGGEFDRSTRQYLSRVVVRAVLR